MSPPPFFTIASRAARLRCPRCGGGRLFRDLFRMFESCPNCNLKYERGPGYFLGSAYINYGLTAMILTAAYMLCRYAFDIRGPWLVGPLTAFCVVFPLCFFRFARSFWLAMDCFIDFESFRPETDAPPSEAESSEKGKPL